MEDKVYKILFEKVSRQLDIERKLNASKQDQIDLLINALSNSEDQKEYMEMKFSELRDELADEDSDMVTTH
jgi:hypothetical protein